MGAPEIMLLWHFTGKYEYVMALPVIVFVAVLNIMVIMDSLQNMFCFTVVLMIDVACGILVGYCFLTKEKPVKRTYDRTRSK